MYTAQLVTSEGSFPPYVPPRKRLFLVHMLIACCGQHVGCIGSHELKALDGCDAMKWLAQPKAILAEG